MPVSGRRSTTTARLGNDTGVRPIAVPAVADDHARLATIITLDETPNAAAASLLGRSRWAWLFRALSRLGLFRLFVEHQRLVHTFETNLRGPAEPVSLAATVRAIIPAAVNPGNIGVSFDVLSYAGVLGVTVVTDPEIVDEPARLTDALTDVFDHLLHS